MLLIQCGIFKLLYGIGNLVKRCFDTTYDELASEEKFNDALVLSKK